MAPATGGLAAAAGGMAAVPETARFAVSEAMGRDDASYLAAATANGYALANTGNQYVATVDATGLSVTSGKDVAGLTLQGIGYGDRSTPLGAATSSATANRVEYDYGDVSQWFVNGPLGVQQGFTLDARPAGSGDGGLLTLDLALTGDLTATVDPGATSVSLVRADGSSALTYGGLFAYDASGQAIPATLSVRSTAQGDVISIQVDDAGAEYPLIVDPLVQQSRFTLTGSGDYSYFGSAVAVSADGNRIVASAPNNSSALGTGVSVYVFDRTGLSWNQTATLTSSDSAQMGQSVAISADGYTVAVGSPYGSSPGYYAAVYVFSEVGGAWTQTARLTPPVGGVTYFGQEVSLSDSGTSLLVGAYGSGAAYAYALNSTTWGLTGVLNSPPVGYQGYVQISLSGDGMTAAVAGPDYSNPYLNAVYVYSFNGSTWTRTAQLNDPDGQSSDYFGNSVSLSYDGGTLLVGAEYAYVVGYTEAGAAYVFSESGGTWSQTAKLTANDLSTYASFGSTVALSGNGSVAVIAASGSFGSVYVFNQSGVSWSQSSKLVSSQYSTYEGFGSTMAVSLDGAFVVVGAPYASSATYSYQGAVYVFANQQTVAITSQPTNVSVTAGSPATFTAAATGAPVVKAQWQVSTDGGSTWTNIPGATNTWYTFTPSKVDTGEKYRAVFSNTVGSTKSTNAATLTVTEAKPLLTITPSLNPRRIGDPLLISVHVTSASGVGAPAGGTVSINIGPYTFSGAPIYGWAVFSIPTLAVFDYTAKASYDGTRDPYFGSSSTTAVESVVRGSTSIVGSLSTQNAAVGQLVTITATVTYAGTSSTPGGGVVIKDGGVPIAFPQLSPGAGATLTAVFSTASLAAGAHYFQLVYLGDSQGSPATSGVYVLTVGASSFGVASSPAPPASQSSNPTTAASPPPSPTSQANPQAISPPGMISPMDQIAYIGSPFTLTAAYPGKVGLSVQWQVSDANVVNWTNVPGATRSWYTYTPTSSDSSKLYRAYFSNGADVAVATNSALVTVAKRNTLLTITPSLNPRRVGDPLSITVQAASASGAGTPTGGVIGLNVGPYVFSKALTNGSAVFTIPALDASNYVVTASYNGTNDTSYASAVATMNQLVVRAGAVITAATSASTVVAGSPLTIATQVTFAGALQPASGGVMFLDGGQPFTQVELTYANGVYSASYRFASLPAGSHYFQMVYLGTSTTQAATSSVYQVDSISAGSFSAHVATAPAPTASATASAGQPAWLVGALNSGSGSPIATATAKESGWSGAFLPHARAAVVHQSRYSGVYRPR